jgi:AcrR family transcriptional regulator
MSFPPRYRTAPVKSRGDLAGEASRSKALHAALELFAVSGFKGTSIAQVAAKTGLSQSGLLHHFPSKAALLSAVLEERDAEDGRFMSNDGEPPLGWAAFDALGSLVARNSTRPQLVSLFVRLSAEAIEPGHPAHQWVRDHYDGIESWLTDALRTGQAQGEVDPEAPIASLVHMTIAVLDGLQQQWLLQPARVSMVSDFAAHVAMLRAQWGTGPDVQGS